MFLSFLRKDLFHGLKSLNWVKVNFTQTSQVDGYLEWFVDNLGSQGEVG